MNLLRLIDQYNRTRPAGEPWMTQASLAKAAGISATMVNLHIHGKRPISADHATRYARVLGVTVEDIREAA